MPEPESHTWLVIDDHRQMIGIIAATEQQKTRLCLQNHWVMQLPAVAPGAFDRMASTHALISATTKKGL
jgi:hypothetical protein